ncbi:hypothetical protein IW140_001957 [Coemansia sp. RSA 1813]|nr:hypothetical protein EV178_001559 [Coemansia sp. RSA 1646]KAJ1771624.1 hypothetical protein LPJ74_002179 [Coemansia sp. RSA 1843]KAJ2089926.1 hypothetical protein IW138_003056 [Coemansia sp. RSA 986]KAJ2215242.1 hypothetical protein EV179_002330 [Coemansia sp. RSA 487]KAJ2571003.1 hypothetical protein IW140_001957 [Coemansia sp. RSA 1813]
MGVKNLTALLARFAPSCISMPRAVDLSGWTVAVDTNIFVQRFFRTPTPLGAKNPNSATVGCSGKRHLRGIYNLATYAQNINVVPVFVFDGLDRVEEKANELEVRRKERERICGEYGSERKRAVRIGVMERIALHLLDDPIDTAAWMPDWQQTEAPEYPVPFRDGWSIEQVPLNDTRICTDDSADPKQVNDNRDAALFMQAASTSVSDAISWLETRLERAAREDQPSASATVAAQGSTCAANKSSKRSTIKDRLDEMELQTCRSLLFRLGVSQDPDDAPPFGDTSYALSTLRQSSSQRLATLACRTEPLTPEHMHDCWQLLRAMGFATHVAESAESECVCVRLTRAGVADAVCSEDLDVMAFGGRRLLRGFFGQGLNSMMLIDHERALSELGLTHEQFVDMCILCGTDFCSTVEKVGPITALKLIRQYGSIEAILATGVFQEREGFCYEIARAVFHSGLGPDIPFGSRDQVRPRSCKDTAVIDGLLPLEERSCHGGSDPFSSGLSVL